MKASRDAKSRVELWAKDIIEKQLGVEVTYHDDNSMPSMVDLIVQNNGRTEYAIECVGAVDPVATETWNVGPATGPFQVDSSGDWLVSIRDTADIRLLKRKIDGVIRDCESIGLTKYMEVDWQLESYSESLFNALNDLGITSLQMYRESGEGRLHLSMDGPGGPVGHNADALVEWVGDFLQRKDKEDVIKKLQNSCALERHAFIVIALGGAPWAAESYFSGRMPLPGKEPKLPDSVTGIWVVSNVTRKGIRYAAGSWHAFTC